MRSKAFNRIFIGLLTVLLFGTGLTATAEGPQREFIKNINREFKTNAKGMTAIYNRNGKVVVKTWNENKVKIDISIVVNANNQETANKIFDRIKVNFTNTTGYVKAETVITSDGKKGNYKKGNDYKINYEVWMPTGNQLDLKNKYGNNYIDQLNGKLTAEIKYGDIRCDGVRNNVNLLIGYGNANLNETGNLMGQLSYSELYVKKAEDIQLDSKYSELNIDKARLLQVTSKYDDFQLGMIDDLRLQTKYADIAVSKARDAFVTAQYTDIEMGVLSNQLDVSLTYGDLKIDQMSKGFKEVKLNTKYADVHLDIEQGAAYQFDTESSYTDLQFPSSATFKRKSKNGSKKVLTGYVGSSSSGGKVIAIMNYGDIIIK